MQRVNLEPFYILHTRPYSNTSLILDCLSEQHGRISLMARSARGPKSRYKGMLQAFSPLLGSWTGNRELKNLGVVERRGPIYQFENTALICGFYLNELLQRLLQREDAHPEIFHLYELTLKQLESESDPRASLRIFEKNLLSSLGYGMPLQREVSTNASIVSEAHYQYIPERGLLRCQEDTANPWILSGQSLIELEEENFTTDISLQESKRLLRLVLNRHLGGKPIKSRELLG